jgi:hypothetical protein
MDEDDKEERRGFRVTDRRRFAETGEPRADTPPEPERPAPPAAEAPHAATSPREETPEPVNFSTFVLGLSTQALYHLGEIPDPLTEQVERDLGAAKQVIDILGILREKTQNNLEPAEQDLLDSILYDLRMRYVELMRSGKKEGS